MNDFTVNTEFQNEENFQVARLPVVSGVETYLIPLGSIIWLEADSNYTKVHIAGIPELLVSSKNLGCYNQLLAYHAFCRIHAKYIVNTMFVTKLIKQKHWSVEMSDKAKTVLDVSESHKDDLLKKLHLITERR